MQNRRKKSYRPLAEINMAPFIDVMMVLLIIFMVAAPMLTVGINVDLPKSEAGQVQTKDEPLIVTIDENKQLYIKEELVTTTTIIPKLRSLANDDMTSRIYIRGDQKLSYGEIMELMGLLTSAGFSRVALIAQLP